MKKIVFTTAVVFAVIFNSQLDIKQKPSPEPVLAHEINTLPSLEQQQEAVYRQPAKQNKNNLNEPEIKKIILGYLTNPEIIALYKGQPGETGPKGDKGDPGISGISSVPTTFANQPDLGVMISANTLSTSILTSGETTITGSLTVEGRAELTQLNVENLNVNSSLTSDSGAFLSQGGVWTNASSLELKENFSEIAASDILNKISLLKISQWNYKKEGTDILHIGPTAEDFYEKFGLGGAAGKTSISTIDPSGIALIGIQELHKKISALEAEIENLKKQQPIISTESNIENPTAIAESTSTMETLTEIEILESETTQE